MAPPTHGPRPSRRNRIMPLILSYFFRPRQPPLWRLRNLIKFTILPDNLRTQANSGPLILRQMAVQAAVHGTKAPDHDQR